MAAFGTAEAVPFPVGVVASVSQGTGNVACKVKSRGQECPFDSFAALSHSGQAPRRTRKNVGQESFDFAQDRSSDPHGVKRRGRGRPCHTIQKFTPLYECRRLCHNAVQWKSHISLVNATLLRHTARIAIDDH